MSNDSSQVEELSIEAGDDLVRLSHSNVKALLTHIGNLRPKSAAKAEATSVANVAIGRANRVNTTEL